MSKTNFNLVGSVSIDDGDVMLKTFCGEYSEELGCLGTRATILDLKYWVDSAMNKAEYGGDLVCKDEEGSVQADNILLSQIEDLKVFRKDNYSESCDSCHFYAGHPKQGTIHEGHVYNFHYSEGSEQTRLYSSLELLLLNCQTGRLQMPLAQHHGYSSNYTFYISQL